MQRKITIAQATADIPEETSGFLLRIVVLYVSHSMHTDALIGQYILDIFITHHARSTTTPFFN